MTWPNLIALILMLVMSFLVGCSEQKKKATIRKVKVARSDSMSDPEILRLASDAAVRFRVPRRRYVTYIDYAKPMTEKRLYVVDMERSKVVLKSFVGHAWKSGKVYPTAFSDEPGTLQSSLGAYRTGESYRGRFGYAMRLDGLQKGVNANARYRAIVFHSYEKSPSLYSHGCFVTPVEINSSLIDLIRGGTLVYVKGPE
jgi:hypothetical protein